MPREHKGTVYLWLDDVRPAPSDQWYHRRTAEDMYQTIIDHDRWGYSMVVSLDHDLGETVQPDGARTINCTGYDLVVWLEKKIGEDDDFTPDIVFNVHSANPVGIQNMERGIRSIYNLVEMKHKGLWPPF